MGSVAWVDGCDRMPLVAEPAPDRNSLFGLPRAAGWTSEALCPTITRIPGGWTTRGLRDPQL